MNHNSRHITLFILLAVWLSLSLPAGVSAQGSVAAMTQVTSHSTNANQVGRYQKFEVTFQLTRAFPPDSFLPYYYYDPADPRGIDGITIDGHFIAPSGREQVIPAFYYQDYVRSGTTQAMMTPTTNFAWKLRFAPEETGTYSYYITVADRSGSSRYPASGTLQFQSLASSSKGFIRVSPRDPRFLEFSNGESFIPNSAGRQWWMPGSALRSLDYDNTFNEFGRNGINLTRIWDQNDGYALTVEGHFDAYKYPDDFNPQDRGIDLNTIPKGTQMNQRGNYEEDKIIEAAERNGVYILLCSHGDPYWIWDASVNNATPASWSDPARLRYWQRNFRYRVARWGYSTAILAWELWNEHGHVSTSSDVYNFYQAYSQYQQQVDAYRHLRTTSQGSQAWSPAFWTSPAFDIATYHDYMMISRYSADLTYDAANFVYRFAQCLRTSNAQQCGLGLGDGSSWQGGPRPILWAELDTGTTNWNEANPQPKAAHDMRWAGLFSPIGMAPIDWYFNQQSAAFTATKYAEAKIASDFFRGVDYAGKGFVYLSTADVRLTSETINASNPALRVLAMRAANGTETYAWVQNKGNARWDQTGVPAPLSATFTIPGMAAGSYSIEIWDTYTGQITNGGTVTANNSQIVVPVSNLTKDVAIKIRPGNQPTPTPTSGATRTPTVTSTPTRVPGTATATATPTPIAPTVTVLPSSTPVMPSATPTRVPPTNTLSASTATPTRLPPTVTAAPATLTPSAVPPATTPVPTSIPGQPGVRLDINPPVGSPGSTLDVIFNLVNISNVFGMEVTCTVNPTVLVGVNYVGSDGFNDRNSLFVNQGFRAADGSWTVAATRVRPNKPISGSMVAFSLRYTIAAPGNTTITCPVRLVDTKGREVMQQTVSANYNQPTVPSPTPVPPTLAPTATPTIIVPTVTPSGSSTIAGIANYPGRDDHNGITVSLASADRTLVEVTTGSSGAYRFTDVPLGTYYVRIRAPQALVLEQAVLVDKNGAAVDLGTDLLVMGDIDGSGVIDVTDATFVSANYGLEGTLFPTADLNRDNRINILDLVLVGNYFGLASPVPMQ
ncbi:MAG: DUF5060 domain-containing protein [Chloroflexi bacterium]|nr:DUF5060 domain-containing protein [Chloroflexota bacterium]